MRSLQLAIISLGVVGIAFGIYQLGVEPVEKQQLATTGVPEKLREAFESVDGCMRIHLCIQSSALASVQQAFQQALEAARAEEIELRMPPTSSGSATSTNARPAVSDRAPG